MSRALLSLALVLAACSGSRRADADAIAEGSGDDAAMNAPPPQTREAFLAELHPLPFAALVVVYDVRGPAGLSGTAEVLAAPGGFRRENWALRLPTGGGTIREIAGSNVQTPDAIWVDGEGVATSAVLGPLADAYLELPDDRRRSVTETVRRWHGALSEVRARDDAGGFGDVMGERCRETRVGTSRVCVWEATGLPLRYDGTALELVATHIDRDPALGPHAFEFAGAQLTPPSLSIEPAAAVERIAAGNVSDLVAVARPAFLLPAGRL